MGTPRFRQCFAPALLAGALLLAATAAGAQEVAVEVKEEFYEVEGRTAFELRREMKARGPKGYWAYTRWRVHWSSKCKVRLNISYTFPKLANRDALPLPLRQNWDSMLAALKAHERRHGENGRRAAAEIAEAGCKDAKAIVKRWSREDGRLDAKTRHGRSEGVVLRD